MRGTWKNGWAVGLLATLLFGVLGCQPVDDGSFQGYVEAEFTFLASPQGGYLAKLAVQRGQAVKPGDLVFSLENQALAKAVSEAASRLQQAKERLADMQKGARPTEIQALEAKLAQASSSLKLTELEYRRRLKLFKQKAIPRADLDRARTLYDRDRAQVSQIKAQLATARLGARSGRVAAAQAEVAAVAAVLARARWNLAQLTRRAPLAGRVFDTYFTAGEWVPPGRPVASLLVPGNLRVRFFVDEPSLSRVKLGQAVELSCDSCPAGLKARVSYVSPQAEYTPPVIYSTESRSKLVFMLEAKPREAAAQLKPGQPMVVRLVAPESQP